MVIPLRDYEADVASVIKQINQLEFEQLKRKLQDPEEGEDWSPDRCDEVEVRYRRFLALKAAYSDLDIVPNKEIDAFWHRHILDTQAYFADCETVFGAYLHHYPYFGLNGPLDARALQDAFDLTVDLYEHHFGEPYGGSATRCRTGCKPVRCK
jgi:hypothetical protein